MSAEDLLTWVYGEYGNKLCLTCSWQKQSSVLVHMVSELGLDLPVIELDTQLFFRETYETRDRLVERYGLNLISNPIITVAEPLEHEAEQLLRGPRLDVSRQLQALSVGVHLSQSTGRFRRTRGQCPHVLTSASQATPRRRARPP